MQTVKCRMQSAFLHFAFRILQFKYPDTICPLTQTAVLDALRVVNDPDLHKDIVSLGFVKNLKIDGGRVAFTIELTTPACPVKDQMRDQARAAVVAAAGRVGGGRPDDRARARSGRRRRHAIADPRREERHRRRRRQGRRRQDDRRRQPRARARAVRQPRRHHRRRHLRPERADHARPQDAAHDRRQEDRAGREVRPAGHLDGRS